jgi:hypothetical protein
MQGFLRFLMNAGSCTSGRGFKEDESEKLEREM